jgi:hypothetical protein
MRINGLPATALVDQHRRRSGVGAAHTQSRRGDAKPGARRGLEKGAQAARAEAILRVLAARNMAVPLELERRIRGSHDISELDRWLDRAATAGAIDELTEE